MKEIWEQLCRELKNYCRQNGFSDVILGLSGGLDSAITAVLAADALGPEHVHAVMMRTKYTSKLSLLIAKKIAKYNAIDYKVLKIQKLVDNQEKFLTEAFGTQPNALVMENLQARERGKILMAYANQYNYLVLACGNKSEAAMGYCTLYGDTCGGLMPIGDLYKSQIFELAKWRNKISSALPKEVIERAPSAELAENQKDEDMLPPYAILDKILKMYIDGQKSQKDIIAAGFDDKMTEWVIKRYKQQNFKRRQMPPAIEIKNIG